MIRYVKLNMNKVLNTFFATALFSTIFLVNSTPALAFAHLQGGNFAVGFNNTTQTGTWRDPIDATAGQIVEFKITAKNDGDQVATDVQIVGSTSGQVPQGLAKQLIMTSRIASSAFGSTIETDTVTVNITSPNDEGLRYVLGHARIQGVTDLYNCPTACDLPDSVNVLGGFEVGDIQPGAAVEVGFKATVTINPGASPSPSPSVSPSTPPAPSQTQTQTQTVNVTQNNNAPAVAGVKTLPKTGLPLAALVGLGSLPAGLVLKKFRKTPVSEDAPESIWEDRQIKLS
jgi:uncharacterized repeat protein (TIGR01451 family)